MKTRPLLCRWVRRASRAPRNLVASPRLATAVAVVCAGLWPMLARAAEPSWIFKIQRGAGPAWEAYVRETFTRPPESLTELWRLYSALIARGEATPAELRQLAHRALHERLTAPDLGTRYRFRDGIELWKEVQHADSARGIRPLAAEVVRRLAREMEDAALRDRFLALSPVGRIARSMDADEVREQELDRIEREILFWVLSDRWIKRKLLELRPRVPDEFRCPAFAGNLPEVIRTALPPECADAWKEATRFLAWEAAHAEPQARDATGRVKREFADVGRPNFEAAIDAFFREPAAFKRETIERFYWTSGFWCGTGGESFRAVQQRVGLMLDLQDRRVPDALGKSLGESVPYNGFPPDFRGPDEWRIPLLELCGLDWEKLFSSTYFTQDEARPPFHCPFGETMLHERGSTYAAKVLLAVERRALAVPREEQVAKNRARGGVPIERYLLVGRVLPFIPRPSEFPDPRPQIEPEVQRELIELLVEDIPREKPAFWGSSLSELARLQLPEIREAIRPLLASRFDSTVQEAAAALRLMGEIPTPPPRRPDARLRVLLNGKETAFDRKLFASIQYRSELEGWGVNNNLGAELTEQGEFRLNRDAVLGAEGKMLEARLVVRPSASELASLDRAPSLEQQWFSAPLPFPIRFDAINEVRVATVPLEVKVTYPRPAAAGQEESIDLTLTWLDEPRDRPTPATVHAPRRDTYCFAALQPGRYRLAVTAPGAARYESGIIAVRERMPPQKVALQPASDVRVNIVVPEFAPNDELPHIAHVALQPGRWTGQSLIAALLRDGKEVTAIPPAYDPQSGVVTISHVPPGDYVVRILSPEDIVAKIGGDLLTEAGEPANAGWARTELPVKISASSPLVHNAGEVHLKRISLPPAPQPK